MLQVNQQYYPLSLCLDHNCFVKEVYKIQADTSIKKFQDPSEVEEVIQEKACQDFLMLVSERQQRSNLDITTFRAVTLSFL